MSAEKILRENIASLMQKRGWTSNDPVVAASDGKVSNGTFGRIRQGKGFNFDKLALIAEVFGVEPWQLLVQDFGKNETPPASATPQPSKSWKEFAFEMAKFLDGNVGPDVNHFQAFCKSVDREYALIYSAIRTTTQGGETSERVEGRHKRPGINTDH